MAEPAKRVFYFREWIHPIGPETMGREPGVELLRFDYDTPPETVWPAIAHAHGYQISAVRDELPRPFWAGREFLARCPDLLVVSANAAGYDTVDAAACSEAGVLVVNQAGGNREAVGEHALAMMLALAKRLIEADRALRRDRAWHRNQFLGHDVAGRTLGVVGLGNIGSRLAQLCGGLFDMPVVAYDPYLAPADFAARGARRAATLDELLSAADIVSVHCPRTSETEGMFGAREFARMRPGALFLNTARGGIHDEAALHEALASGHLGGAGLDVWDPEPPALDHPLLKLDNVILSPHTAGATEESRRNTALWAVEQWRAIWRGERPPRLINADAWPRYRERFARILGRPTAA
ncbi:MAG: hydroxyacid dehydrogenase [Proteobacteria bacterium]|nr:hydroxyacid dehydrogenase [Pseudomonadota bacterium]